MSEKLSASALVINQLPYKDGHYAPAYGQIIESTGEAGLGLLAFGNYALSASTSIGRPYGYGYDDERRVSDSYAVLIITGSTFSESRNQWPGINFFQEEAGRVIPVALVHDQELPEGVELGPNDIAISTETLDSLRPTLHSWLGKAMILLSER
jgi:hypothetical protein